MRSVDAPLMPEQLRLTVRPIGRKDPIALFRRVQRGRWPFFLDSSLPEPELARYSFLGSDPVGWFRSRGPRAAYATPWGERSTSGNPLEALGRFIESLPRATAGTPSYPFLGGPVGYFAYDLGQLFEQVPDEKPADLQTPDIHLAVYPRVYIIDRIWGETFVVAPRTRIEYEPPPIPDDLAVPPDPRPIHPLASEDGSVDQRPPRGVRHGTAPGIRDDGGRVPGHVRLRAPRPEVVPGSFSGPAVRRPDAEQARLPAVQCVLRAVPDHEGHGDLVQAAAPLPLRDDPLFVPRGTARRGGRPAAGAGPHAARPPAPPSPPLPGDRGGKRGPSGRT